jgi:putative flippase GtrA
VLVEFSLIVGVFLVALGLTEGVALELHHTLGWSIFLAKAVAVVAVFFWNYCARRYFIYRPRSVPRAS